MKSFTILAAAALALLTAVPFTAQAQEWGGPRYGCGWRHRDIAIDRHNLNRQWRDIRHDRFELRQDMASGNWAAAQAERNDLRHDYFNVDRQRRDIRRDYQGQPYMVPMSYNPVGQPYYGPHAYLP